MENYKNIPELFEIISSKKAINSIFKVLAFEDLSKINNGSPVTKSRNQPYGYIIVSSPFITGFTQAKYDKARIKLIHKVDYALVRDLFDKHNVYKELVSEKIFEALVAYKPRITVFGLSASPLHVLHFTLAKRGTLLSYYQTYSYQANKPELIFKKFDYTANDSINMNDDFTITSEVRKLDFLNED